MAEKKKMPHISESACRLLMHDYSARTTTRPEPKCPDTKGTCFARNGNGCCTILNSRYIGSQLNFGGKKCPFKKPKRSVTNGVRY